MRFHRLSSEEFSLLRNGADILEQDAHGPKVFRLKDGKILKMFRIKRLFSSAWFRPYSKRFCHNARMLHEAGIPTISVCAGYFLKQTRWSAVLYQPLEGRTLRELAREGELKGRYLEDLGTFVAVLHDKGIYFRSLHLGNIVLTFDGQFGLIDIADMSFVQKALSHQQRLRNFRHLFRLPDDRRLLSEADWRRVIESYLFSNAQQNEDQISLRSHCYKLIQSVK